MKLNILSRVMLLIAAMLLAGAVHVPIWQIDLVAPQYPEGLRLLIFADEIGGDVEIINGLNHYIGMQTLHTDDFFEFTILPYILYAFAALTLLVMLAGNRKWLTALCILFLVFGIVSIADFWWWEYKYGHNLDPNAPIIVPGMAYQPPLLGFKQLLNFGAFSIPDIGGWMLLVSGLIMFGLTVYENGWWQKLRKKAPAAASLFIPFLLLTGCGKVESRPIQVNRDVCANCKMNITELPYSAEAVNKNGKVFTFDDLKCLLQYNEQQGKENGLTLFIADYNNPNSFVEATTAWYVKGGKLSSPMGGNTAAFTDRALAEKFSNEQGGNLLDWNTVSTQ
ncbi:MAG: nitrous oxide reductase accessory protein NosL [Bacteroidia bacterium]|jgi:copper chaperone NosL|nr:nitrous oxide reductase accessory protein NosL [Bacteroidia bacterium]MCC6768586.1 nitrous oxide reductase accessory protein NosL [Bacteroidia bacterium]